MTADSSQNPPQDGTLSRRSFIQSASAGAAASALLFSGARSYAANERVRHAVIGLGGQGGNHARVFASHDDCELLMVCDLDPKRREKCLAELPEGAKPKAVERFEEVFENPEVDSVSITTPDHWHTPLALMALKAGKHVYVEKPCCHNVHEGIMLEKAQQATGLCVQHGTQHRSGQGSIDGIKWLNEGHIGKVRAAKAINHQFRGPIGRQPVSDPPPGVDYDRWLGPAPLHPFTLNRWHYNWHWFWDYGCGDTGNDGIHQMDVARWGLGVGYPTNVDAPGGQLLYDDDHETPDTQIATFRYPDSYLIYEMRLWTPYPIEGHDNGVVFYADKGKLEIGRKGVFATLADGTTQRIGDSQDFSGNTKNFLACIKAKDPSKLNAPVGEAVCSATLCHLANIATRVSRPLQYDHAKLECLGDEEATGLLKREYREGYELPQVG